MRIIEAEQRSPEWFAARLGIPTASNFDMLVDTEGKPSKQRQKYLYQLVGERLTGKSEEIYQNAAMQRGTELEPEARAFYEMVTGNKVKQVGFCLEDGGRWGCSPDGLTDITSGLEIKCPMIHTHIKYLIDGKLPTDYFQQVQGSMFILTLQRYEFVSYYPGMKPLIVTVKSDYGFIEKLEKELIKFCKELDETTEKLRA